MQNNKGKPKLENELIAKWNKSTKELFRGGRREDVATNFISKENYKQRFQSKKKCFVILIIDGRRRHWIFIEREITFYFEGYFNTNKKNASKQRLVNGCANDKEKNSLSKKVENHCFKCNITQNNCKAIKNQKQKWKQNN